MGGPCCQFDPVAIDPKPPSAVHFFALRVSMRGAHPEWMNYEQKRGPGKHEKVIALAS
jgi:hypothetical protein